MGGHGTCAVHCPADDVLELRDRALAVVVHDRVVELGRERELALRDVEPRHDLDAGDDGRRQPGGLGVHRLQDAVVAAADAEAVLERLDVDVRGARLERVGDQERDEADDRRLGREVESLVRRGRLTGVQAPDGGADPGAPADPAAGGTEPDADISRFGFTPRELDVFRLVAAGRTNPGIAAELFISAKTASTHVSNILAKLDVGTRGEAAAIAHRLRLFEDPQPA